MITVNDKTISETVFDMACNNLKREMRMPVLNKEYLMAIANQLVESKLLFEEAIKQNMDISAEQIDGYVDELKASFPNEEEFLAAIKTQGESLDNFKQIVREDMVVNNFVKVEFLDKVNVPDDDVKSYYDKHIEHFKASEQVKAAHILFRTDEKANAEKVREELLGGADFAELAQEHSQCPSKERGGDLGFFGKGQMVPEFEKAAFEGELNSISDLVETQFGYHIIKVEEKQEARTLAFDEVKDRLKKQLEDMLVNENIKVFASKLREDADVAIDENLIAQKAGK